jgi:site-specific recombinase XerD
MPRCLRLRPARSGCIWLLGAKSARTIRAYTDAVQWLAAEHLLRRTSRDGWEQVDGQDIQQWVAWLLANYSDAYASSQFRALQQFFRWLAAEDEIPDPMAGLRSPKVYRGTGFRLHRRGIGPDWAGVCGPQLCAAA